MLHATARLIHSCDGGLTHSAFAGTESLLALPLADREVVDSDGDHGWVLEADRLASRLPPLDPLLGVVECVVPCELCHGPTVGHGPRATPTNGGADTPWEAPECRASVCDVTKLNQILGIRDGVKNRAEKTITALHRTSPSAFLGISGVYTPFDDADVTYPAESTLVQVRGRDVISAFQNAMRELIDIVATTDTANCGAFGDIVLDDGTVLARRVPAVTLIFLEKKIEDLKTFVSKLPLLDPAESWTWDDVRGVYATPPVQSFRMKKVLKNHVKATATDKHPAQVEVYTEDVPVGTWARTKFSGGFPEPVILAMLGRVEELRQAVVYARGEANAVDVENVAIGQRLLEYVFTTP